jgi:hypothetical protein
MSNLEYFTSSSYLPNNSCSTSKSKFAQCCIRQSIFTDDLYTYTLHTIDIVIIFDTSSLKYEQIGHESQLSPNEISRAATILKYR